MVGKYFIPELYFHPQLSSKQKLLDEFCVWAGNKSRSVRAEVRE